MVLSFPNSSYDALRLAWLEMNGREGCSRLYDAWVGCVALSMYVRMGFIYFGGRREERRGRKMWEVG